jgi:hypothetical protein
LFFQQLRHVEDNMRYGIIVFGAALALAACGQTHEERAGTGALGGAAAGAVVGGPVGALVGAGVGGAGGAYREEIKEEAKDVAHSADRGTHKAVSSVTGNPVQMDQSQIRSMQAQLKSEGYYNGPVDGIMGPQTRTALAAYQQRHGLPQTAQADEETMERMHSGMR